jgi:hypothetical protein
MQSTNICCYSGMIIDKLTIGSNYVNMEYKSDKHLLKIIIAATLIFLSLALPSLIWMRDFFIDMHSVIDSDKLSDLATFLNSVISLWLLVSNIFLVWIAYKAYRNFDVKKQFHNKQLTIVTELASEISSLIISNMMCKFSQMPDGKITPIKTGFRFNFIDISFYDYSEYFGIYIIEDNNIENLLPFLKYRNNPVLPNSIAVHLTKLYKPLQYSLGIRSDDFDFNYVYFYNNYINQNNSSVPLFYEYYKNPADFNRDCRDLQIAIIKWFKDYGAEDVNISSVN